MGKQHELRLYKYELILRSQYGRHLFWRCWKYMACGGL